MKSSRWLHMVQAEVLLFREQGAVTDRVKGRARVRLRVHVQAGPWKTGKVVVVVNRNLGAPSC